MSHTEPFSSLPPSYAIDAIGLSRRYGRRWALADVGFRLPAGAMLLLAGRNGSGKSTLLRLLATAIRPDHGRATVAGHDLSELESVRRAVCLLGHHSYSYESLSARENLAVAARMIGADASPEAIDLVLERVGLAGRGADVISTFSAGMRKRVAFGRILMQPAEVILLDEPYGQLDPAGFAFVDQLIDSLRSEGRTIVVATHLLERGAELADYALILDEGRLRWSGRASGLPHAWSSEPSHLREVAI
jgi:heme exporter protein A